MIFLHTEHKIQYCHVVDFVWNLGTPTLGGPLEFVHPAHPTATPLAVRAAIHEFI